MNRTERLDRAIDSAIARKKLVGTVVLVAEHGRTVYARAAGLADREAGTPMREDTIFRLTSVTKPMVAATILAMVERGLVGLDDSAAKYVEGFAPRLADGTPATITVRHLLTHTSGLSYDSDAIRAADAAPGLWGPLIDIQENARRLGSVPLKFAPGTAWLYSTAIDVLGAIAAKVHGGTLEEAMSHYVCAPLGMRDTAFHVIDTSRLAVPYADGPKEPVRMGETHTVGDAHGGSTLFTPGRVFEPRAPQSGGAGALGTAGDFLKFLEALQAGGAPILKAETVDAGLSNQIGDIPRDHPKDIGKAFGFFGAVLLDPAVQNSPANVGTVDWGGVYGHNWFIDRAAGLSVVSYSNTAIEGCNGPFREEIRNAVYG